MARDLQDSELYNGSAAYRIYPDYQGTAAPEIEHQGLPEERRLPQKKKRVKAKSAISPFAVVGLAVNLSNIFIDFRYEVGLHNFTESIIYDKAATEPPYNEGEMAIKRRLNVLSFSVGVIF